MESVITASGLAAHWDAGADSPSRLSDPHLADPDKITDRLSTLIISDEGKSRFLGNSFDPAFPRPIFDDSPRCLFWILIVLPAGPPVDF